MQVPLQITFRHMDSSDAVAARIRERAEELEWFFDRIGSCRVVVECRHPRRLQGNLFRVRVDLKVPGRNIVVGRDPAAHHAHEDVYVAIRDWHIHASFIEAALFEDDTAAGCETDEQRSADP